MPIGLQDLDRAVEVTTRRWGDVVFADQADGAVLTRAVRRGTLRRIGAGIYVGDVDEPPAVVARRAWRTILAHEMPGAVVADRNARTGVPDPDGTVRVLHPRQRTLVLPGLVVRPRRDQAPGVGVVAMPDGIGLMTVARGLLDNLGGRGDRFLSRQEVERWIADVLREHGEIRLNAIRHEARAIAPVLGRTAAVAVLDRLIAAALTTGRVADVETEALSARARGQASDERRVAAFEALVETLDRIAPEPMPDLPTDAARRRLLPFYEAYFSNFIEGTEFEIDEAAEIVLDGDIPAERPADAHDVIGTYRIVSDPVEMHRVPRSAEDLLGLLRERHAVLLAARPEAGPGQFKRRSNRAGSTVFVAPDLVDGTLRVGFDRGRRLVDPFARAVFMMFLVSEVHPFADGNGRIARVHMNAELVAGGEIRVIIPTVYRNNYLAALKAASLAGAFEPLAATLRFAQRYTARLDCSDRAIAERQLAATHAFRDPTEAEANGIRLVLP